MMYNINFLLEVHMFLNIFERNCTRTWMAFNTHEKRMEPLPTPPDNFQLIKNAKIIKTISACHIYNYTIYICMSMYGNTCSPLLLWSLSWHIYDAMFIVLLSLLNFLCSEQMKAPATYPTQMCQLVSFKAGVRLVQHFFQFFQFLYCFYFFFVFGFI